MIEDLANTQSREEVTKSSESVDNENPALKLTTPQLRHHHYLSVQIRVPAE
jgi:hypothetical protein